MCPSKPEFENVALEDPIVKDHIVYNLFSVLKNWV